MPAASPAAEATSGTAAADAVPVPCSSGTASGLPVHWWPGVPGWNPGWTGMMYDPNGGGVAAPAGPVGGGPPTFSSYGFKWWSSGHGGPVLVTSQLGRDLRRRFLAWSESRSRGRRAAQWHRFRVWIEEFSGDRNRHLLEIPVDAWRGQRRS